MQQVVCGRNQQINKIVHDWINRLTPKDNKASYLFMFGGPCHLSIFKQCPENIITLTTACLFSYRTNKYFWVTSLILHFEFSKTTQCPFNFLRARLADSSHFPGIMLSYVSIITVAVSCSFIFRVQKWSSHKTLTKKSNLQVIFIPNYFWHIFQNVSLLP